MIYGMYVSASGLMTAMARQDVMSNNLANLSTPGFKPDRVDVRQRDVVRVEDNVPFLESNALLERLGGGVLLSPTRVSLAQGGLEQTGNPLDFAVDGKGFLVVDSGQGQGAERLRLTRDGRMTLDSGGRLVRVADGAAVVDEDGDPIVLDPAEPVTVSADGAVRQGAGIVARLRMVDVRDPSALTKTGGGLFRAAEGSLIEASGLVRQGHVERSGVDPVMALMDITKAGSAVERNARMIQLHYETVGRAISTLGRVS